ncbi:MAG TPA: molybdopterin-dependent oxidoreductase, partial [Mesotoga sp.]|nr:molybdopterin-dependent oxidoreductase [Mesotoga sp.]
MKVLLFIFLCVIVVTVIVFGINNSPKKDVQEILVRDYQGIRLDDLSAFRENSIKGVQYVNEENYILRIGGLVERPYEMSYSTLQELEHTEKVVTLFCVEGWTAKMLWGGIPLVELIEKAGPMAE